jgi:Notch-like protein
MRLRVLRLIGAAAIAAFALSSAAACQVALRAEDEDAHCAPDGIKCGPGLTCDKGICRACVPKPEECNLVDDDCDGEIDEDFDLDGDGFKQCGATGQIDCNDDPKRNGRDVFPGAPEICNGYDDNCDGVTDESPNDCGEDQECWSAKGKCTIKGDCRIHGCEKGKGCNGETGECTGLDCRVNPLICMSGEECNRTSGACEKITAIGEPCDVGSKCTVGSACLDLTRAGISARSAAICTKACCESIGCPDAFVCKTGTTGSSLCVKAQDLSLTTGTLVANARCTTNDECRSGVCASGFCLDSCCGSPSCGEGGTCALKGDGKFLCRAATGSGATQSACDRDSECKTGFCYGAGSWAGGECSKHCCSSEDCFGGWKCTNFTAAGAIVPACSPLAWGESAGTKRAGEACTANNQCRSARCTDGICSDACCRDADCAGGTVCKPTGVSGGIALRCVKP